jgi:hypothetical protein
MHDEIALPSSLARKLRETSVKGDGTISEVRRRVEEALTASPNRAEDLAPALEDLRALEGVGVGLPPVLDGIRRSRLLAADLISSTWEGWEIASGRAVVVRYLSPQAKGDARWQRRLVASAERTSVLPSLCGATWRGAGQWPHVLYEAPGVSLHAFLPIEDPASLVETARLAAFVLGALAALHAGGVVHGGPQPGHIRWDGRDFRLLWLDPVQAIKSQACDDFCVLGETLSLLERGMEHPLGALGAEWAAAPPTTGAVAEAMFRAVLVEQLTACRHGLFQKARGESQRVAAARLYSAMKALRHACGPPVASVCLYASADGELTLAYSFEGALYGGTASTPTVEGLPILHTPGERLDARGARALIRAWMRRRRGDEARRRAAQEVLGGTDEQAERLIRWILAGAQLRTLLLLSEATWLEGVQRSA